jgi:hypothetical protein
MFLCVAASPRLRAHGITCDMLGPPYPSCVCSFQRRETAPHKLQDDGARPVEADSKFLLQAPGRLSRKASIRSSIGFPTLPPEEAAGAGMANDSAVWRAGTTLAIPLGIRSDTRLAPDARKKLMAIVAKWQKSEKSRVATDTKRKRSHQERAGARLAAMESKPAALPCPHVFGNGPNGVLCVKQRQSS